MGLFQKQECVLCGNKAGLITRSKIAGGEYICGDCRGKMSDLVEGLDKMSADDIRYQISLKEENDRKYQSSFSATRQFDFDGRHPMMAVDDNTGEFAILTKNRPDIFSFDEISSYTVDLNTRVLTDEERQKQSGLMSVLNFFLSDDFGTRFPDLPKCPMGCKVTGMYFHINFGPNRYNAKDIRIDMLPNWSSSETEIEKAYLCANSMYQCIKEYKEGAVKRAQTAAAQADSASAQAGDIAEQLKKLKELVDMDILTQEEFDAKKKQLLGI